MTTHTLIVIKPGSKWCKRRAKHGITVLNVGPHTIGVCAHGRTSELLIPRREFGHARGYLPVMTTTPLTVRP